MEKLTLIQSPTDQYRLTNNLSNKKRLTQTFIRGNLIKLAFACVVMLMVVVLIFKYAMLRVNYNQRVIDLEQLKLLAKETDARRIRVNEEIESQKKATEFQMKEIVTLEGKIAIIENDIYEFNSDIEAMTKQKLNYDAQYMKLTEELRKVQLENEKMKEDFKDNHKNNNDNNNKPNRPVIISSIIQNEQERDVIEQWANKRISSICYETNQKDLFNLDTMNRQCKDSAPTVVLVKSVEGPVFGGYTQVPWSRTGVKADQSAFIFNLQSKTKYSVKEAGNAVVSGGGAYIAFGDDLIVASNFIVSKFPFTYGDKSLNHREELCGNNKDLTIFRVEVLTFE